MTSIADRLEIIAKEHCSSVCAIYFGDPPCYQVGPWPNEECSDPVCAVIAKAVALLRAMQVARGEDGTRYVQAMEDLRLPGELARVPSYVSYGTPDAHVLVGSKRK